MARPLRFSYPWQPVELTARTFQGRFLLQPSRRLNLLTAGVLAEARERFEVRIYGFVFLSNHFHMLAAAASPAELSSFMCFVMSNIAREAGRLQAWSGHFWGGRHRAIPVVDDASLVGRLSYIFKNGCKEGLVSHPSQWKGLQCVEALTKGTVIPGQWLDRSALYRARKRAGATVKESKYSKATGLKLDVFPLWKPFSVKRRWAMAAALIEDAARSAPQISRAKRRANKKRIVARSPHWRPKHLKHGASPRCHAATRKAREAFKELYKAFVGAFRRASEKLSDRLPRLGFPAHAQVMAYAVPSRE